MGAELLAALGLVLVFEGLVVSASPATWKRAMRQLLETADEQLRIGGVVIMVIGAVLLALSRS